MALFYPATTPTRRKRRQIHWAGVAAVLSAVMSASMITQVYTLYRERYEKRLEEMHVPVKARTTEPAAEQREHAKPRIQGLPGLPGRDMSNAPRVVTLQR